MTSGGSTLAELVASGTNAISQPESGERLIDDEPKPGTPVTLKIVVVHYAAKGLYPIIKPRELKEAGGGAFVLDLLAGAGGQGSTRTIEALRAMNDPSVQAAISELDLVRNRLSVPVYPYQYISFNTFRYTSIEALTATASGFGPLYDQTGVAGDRGDSQTADLQDILREALRRNLLQPGLNADDPPANPGLKTGATEALEAVRTRMIAEINEFLADDKAPEVLKGVSVVNAALDLAVDGEKRALSLRLHMRSELSEEQERLLMPIAESLLTNRVGDTSELVDYKDATIQVTFRVADDDEGGAESGEGSLEYPVEHAAAIFDGAFETVAISHAHELVDTLNAGLEAFAAEHDGVLVGYQVSSAQLRRRLSDDGSRSVIELMVSFESVGATSSIGILRSQLESHTLEWMMQVPNLALFARANYGIFVLDLERSIDRAMFESLLDDEAAIEVPVPHQPTEDG